MPTVTQRESSEGAAPDTPSWDFHRQIWPLPDSRTWSALHLVALGNFGPAWSPRGELKAREGVHLLCIMTVRADSNSTEQTGPIWGLTRVRRCSTRLSVTESRRAEAGSPEPLGRMIWVNPCPAFMTSYDVYGDVFPTCHKDVTGRPSRIVTVPTCSGQAKFQKLNVSGLVSLSVRLLLGRNSTSSTNSLAARELTKSGCTLLVGCTLATPQAGLICDFS